MSASQALHLAEAPIEELIQGTKDGSVEHFKVLFPQIHGKFETHSIAILDALLQHLKPPRSGEPDPINSIFSIVAVEGIYEINRLLVLHPGQTPVTVGLSLRLFSAADDYIDWAKAYLRESESLENEEVTLGSYHMTTRFFHSLVANTTRIARHLSGKRAMLDLAIQWWTSVCDGAPIMYAEEISPKNPTCDAGLIVFRSLTVENPNGMAKAIMDGRVCSPDVFVQRTVDRARCLVRLNELRRLSSQNPATAVHARASFLCLLDATRHLREYSPTLQELFRKTEILTVFMEVLGGIRQIAVQPPLSSPEDWGKGCAAETVEVLEVILEWVLCTPSGLVDSVHAVVENGFLMHLGDTLPFSEDENSRYISLLRLLVSYATYPRALRAIETGLASHIVPKIHYLETGSAQHSYLNGLPTGLKSLRMLAAVQAQTSLCDSMQHHSRQRSHARPTGERVCAGCRTVAYCSKACQFEDWKALHRRECPEMRKIYLENKSAQRNYPYRNRKYHTTLSRTFYESCEVFRRTVADTQDKWHAYDPCKVAQAIVILPEDMDQAVDWGTDLDAYLARTLHVQNAFPSHLRPRFDAFISAFRQSISAARLRPSTPLHLRHGPGKISIPNDSSGSLRLAERSFRWGETREKRVVLLFEQVMEIPVFTGLKPFLAEEMALEVGGRGVNGDPVFKIVASLVYECPRKAFTPMKSVVADHER